MLSQTFTQLCTQLSAYNSKCLLNCTVAQAQVGAKLRRPKTPSELQDPAKAKKLNEEIDAGGWRNPEEIEMKGEKEKNRDDGNDLGCKLIAI